MKTNHYKTTNLFSMMISKRCFLVLALALASALPAWAQQYQYVFLYKEGTTVYFLYNNNRNVDRTATFNANTCVFTGTGTTTSTFYNGDRYLRRNGDWTLEFNTNYTTWTINNGTVNNDNRYYIQYWLNNGGTNNGWQTLANNPNNPTNSSQFTVLFAYINQAPALSNLNISGNDVLTATGNYTYSVTAQATAQYHQFDGYSGPTATSYYWYNNALQTTAPSGTNVTTGTWSLTGGDSYASVNSSSGTITVNSIPTNDIEMTLSCTITANGVSETATKTILLCGSTIAAPSITRSGNDITLETTSLGATIYYTTDGSAPTLSSTAYTGAFNIENLSYPVTVKAIAIRNGNSSSVATQTYNNPICATPVITISSTGNVTITCDTEGATIYYTTNGNNPTSGDTQYNGPFDVANQTTVKAIAVKNGYINSNVATAEYVSSGISGNQVILNDLEDHSWSYYSDGDQPIHSLNPADVKITYFGDGIMMTGSADYTASSTDYVQFGNANYVGNAKVNVGGENENTFVYYKTLERENADGSGRCPYTPIPNPFQVRPTYGSTWDGTNTATWTGWRGFQCWRLKSVTGGAVYAVASGGTALTTGAVINAETEIYFAPNAEYGMEVQLEAVWAIAYVVKANGGQANAIQTQTVGYERNFIVLHSTNSAFNFGGTTGKRITNINYSATVSTYYPDGTQGDNAGSTLRGAGGTDLILESNTKFENIQFSMDSYAIITNNHDVILGRGCTGTVNNLRGINADVGTAQNPSGLDYTMRIETGTINQLAFVRDGGSGNGSVAHTIYGRVLVKAILGSDYDRAKKDNSKLSVSNENTLFYARGMGFASDSNKDQKVFDCVVKSGEYQKAYWDTDANPNGITGTDGFNYVHSMYCGHNFNVTTTNYPGSRYVTIEGGQLGNVNGGRGTGADGNNDNPDATTNQTDAWKIAFSLRIKKDAVINGCVFGGAANTSAWGSKRIVLTGGKVYSWIAGGANGTNTTNGDSRTRGASYIYVGGNAEVGGPNAKMKNSTLGGQVFGAGRGFTNQAASMDTSYVVIADNAKIMKKNNDASGNVYGGGNIGYIHKQSNVYILGGTIEGGVYGGAFNNGLAIPEVNITMTGGLVEGGVYGGSNTNGTISGNVTMHIDGGQVGTSSANANVHGGGYGQPTRVNGNVELNLGTCNATTGATVFGDVYGGSAMGVVNTNNNNTTTVSLYKGTIYGGLYGGGYGPGGEDADVNGKVYVKVYGGSVLCSAADPDGEAGTGSVFGCNNISGTPQSTVNVDIYSTDQPASGYALHAVYGGGNKAPYTQVPVVTVHGCNNSIEYVYGGGNATNVRGTDVTIWGGTIGNAFGGGNGFSVTGNHNDPTGEHYNPGANITANGTNLKIYGGEIGAAFGGSNQFGTINSTINVTVDTKTEPGSDPCSGVAYEECDLVIDELYGGGNEAPIQTSGNVWITPTVQVLACDAHIKNFFGGAKKADYGGNIVTNIVAGRFDNVFGGNNQGGVITGNVTLNLQGGTIGNAFGGCNEDGNITGNITVNVLDVEGDCPLYITNIYGGSNLASYEPTNANAISPLVNVAHAKYGIKGNVYGGGKGLPGTDADVKSNPRVNIGYDPDMDSYIPQSYKDNYMNYLDPNEQDTKRPSAIVAGSVFGGGDAAKVIGNTIIYIRNRAKVFGNVYGGGNMGEVTGDTKVIVDGDNR